MVAVTVPEDIWGDAEGEGLLERWLVSEGDTVAAGQPLAEAVIIKTNLEVVAPAAGVVSRILVPDQGTFGRGQALAQIDTP